MDADNNFFDNLYEFNEEEIRDIRILFAIDPPDPKSGPIQFVETLAENELIILQKVLINMNETRVKVKIREQKRVTYMICLRCGKPFKRSVRNQA